MCDKKPLRDKKLKRMLMTKKKKIKEQRKTSELSADCRKIKPPANLKGKEIGLWYRDRKKLINLEHMANLKEKQLTKKERKALIKQKLGEKQDKSIKIYKISIDTIREQIIKEYLSTVINEPPSLLISQSEYRRRINQNIHKTEIKTNNIDKSNVNNVEPKEIPELVTGNKTFTVDELLTKAKKFYEDFPFDISDDLSVSKIQTFLTDNVENYCDGKHHNQSLYDHTDDWAQNLNGDKNVLDSLDKYKYLEETPFKRQFLNTLSGSIETTLEKTTQYNLKLQKNPAIDRKLRDTLLSKNQNYQYRTMKSSRQRLPAFKMRKEILNMVEEHRVILISGETGCGKTTQVAQYILDDIISKGDGSLCNIICTQPRRISAISIAQRVADERAEEVGKGSIGYQIRLEKKIGRQYGAITYCTTGILLQFMQNDPALQKYSHVILDEIHERDTLCDFVLTILKTVITKRLDLKIILMSATLNAEQFSIYFDNCPSINIPGYTYPVVEYYLEDVLNFTKFTYDTGGKSKKKDDLDEDFKNHVLPYVDNLREQNVYPEFVLNGLSNPESEKIQPELIVELLHYISYNQGPGAILVFVPGWEEINSIIRTMDGSGFFPISKFLIIPLHSMLPTTYQRSVFDRPPAGKRKIIIATNIAETSITIDDVVYVVDCGKIKIKNYDVVNNISTLKPEFVSLANAKQRRGRAGRVQNGVCYHLFSRGREMALSDYPLSEMLRTRLEEVILNIKLLQLGKARSFLEKVLDPPNPRAIFLSLELLWQLAALDENENLTPLGYHLAKLPLDPQIGKVLLMGVTMSCLNPILSIAATLSFKDPFYFPMGEEQKLKERKLELDRSYKSDHLIMAEVIDRWEEEDKRSRLKGKNFCSDNFLTFSTMQQLRNLKSQFSQYLYEMGFIKNHDYKQKNLNRNSDNVALVKAVICSGLYPNVAIIKRTINSRTKNFIVLETSEDGKVSLHPKSVNSVQQDNFESCFLVYREKLRSTNIFLHDSTMVSALPLLIFCHDFYLKENSRDVTIQLKKDLLFSCDKNLAKLIVELKLRLSWLLEHKLTNPEKISWNDDSLHIDLLKVLTILFTAENDSIMNTKCDSSSE